METTFVQALKGESAVVAGSNSGAFLWDLANYYEHIDHEVLWQRARDRRFPLALLAVALNQYRARRFLGLGDVAVDSLFPVRGLAAGDGFATTLVQVFALDPLEHWSAQHPRVALSMFVDDLMGDVQEAEEHQVVGHLTAGAAALQIAIEHDLGCRVAEHKSVLVASSAHLLQKLRTSFGKFSGSREISAPNLGVDFFAGRRRAHRKSTGMLRKREGAFLRRARRLRALKQSGYDMYKLYVTGLQAYSFYGADVVGLDPAQLKRARASYLGLEGSPARSRSAAVALVAAGDPLWRQGLGPMLTWSSIIWKAATSRSFQAFADLPRLGA